MHGRGWVWAAAMGGGLIGVHQVGSDPVVMETAWTVLVLGAAAGVVLGIVRHRPTATGPWWVLATGLGLFGLGNVLNHPALALSAGGVITHILELIAFPLLGVAVHGMVRRRLPGGDREGALDGAVVMVALAAVLSGTVFTRDLLTSTSALEYALIVVAPLLLAAVTASAMRLLWIGARLPSVRLVVAGSLAAMAGHVLRTLAQADGSYARGELPDLLIGVAYLTAGLAALHPSMQAITEPRAERGDGGLSRIRMAILGLGLVAPPLTLVAGADATLGPLLASVVVALLVLWRVWALLDDRERVREHLRHRAVHDELTGLPNRALLLEHLRAVLDRSGQGARTAVVFIDLDGFKQVNDEHGHRAGDETLIAVADRLRGGLRDGDVLARLAGDEFVAVCEDIDDEGIDALGARLLAALRSPVTLRCADVRLRASIGIAVSGGGDVDVERLLGEADAAMYAAKERGGAAAERYGADLGRALARRRLLAADLPSAIREDRLRLVYQPVRRAARPHVGELVGAEALLRFNHPSLGRVAPSELVAVADRTGSMDDLGHWVLATACADLATWRADGLVPEGFRLFINVSPRQLHRDRLPARVRSTLATAGLRGEDIVLEITENAVLDDEDGAVATLRALREQGVRIALDDFGTGASSLTHLKRLPLDIIKIDATFVEDLERSADDRAIVGAVIAIARQLGAQVVGEGVERPEQAVVLRELGCDLLQGYHLGRPSPPAAMAWTSGVPGTAPARSRAPVAQAVPPPVAPAVG
jgi:diguanylate cyclase (GGDEF)-like protein